MRERPRAKRFGGVESGEDAARTCAGSLRNASPNQRGEESKTFPFSLKYSSAFHHPSPAPLGTQITLKDF